MTLIVVGLGFGDEGKGATVDALVARTGARSVVRFNGGQQAAHNVIAGGIHHKFQSYGSGTLSGAETWISRHCTVEPLAALRERHLLRMKGVATEKIHVDNECLVTTHLHVMANHARELARGDERHGSTGRGFGETVAYGLRYPDDAIRVKHLRDPMEVAHRLSVMRQRYADGEGIGFEREDYKKAEAETLYQCLRSEFVFDPFVGPQLLEEIAKGRVVMEGAQGFWLDENFGFHPHTTWSTTTPANARQLCREAGVEASVVGVLRTYATRHGQGPFPGEGGLERPPEAHNSDGAFAGAFRVGRWDQKLLIAAVDTAVPDLLSVTHLDRFPSFMTEDGLMDLEALGVPIGVAAYGPQRGHRIIDNEAIVRRAA